ASAVAQDNDPLVFESVIFLHLERPQQYTDNTAGCTCQPENDDNLPLAPATELEMMMDRCHFEYPFACQFERCNLQHDRRRLDDEHDADDEEQQTVIQHDGDSCDNPGECKSACVTHENL